jgi:lipoprotein-anchoring transpeptidase ErfK/SrfK
MRWRRLPLSLAAFCLLFVSSRARTDEGSARELTLPPWSATNIPAWAQSVHVLKGDQPMRSAPHAEASRRGSAMRERHLPLFGARHGPGCRAPWLHVGPQAWVCQDDVKLSGRGPDRVGLPLTKPNADGLPFRYFFAAQNGSLAYDRIEQVDVGEPSMTLEPGFAVAIVEERGFAGERYGRTNRNLWVPMRDFGAARSFSFSGSDIGETVDEVVPFAWVAVDKARLYRRRGALFSLNGRHKTRFEKVSWYEEAKTFLGGYARIDDDNWVRSKDIRHPTLKPPPEEIVVSVGEHWIDVELDSQTLVAYEGAQPVFATMVSTGKGKTKGHPFETPKGVSRIWVKLLSSVMDNLENEDANRYYRIEDVPYVQYFSKGVGLHAAFWHRSFGHVRSHGCVNMAPLDAKRLFSWTGPHMPTGWTAALPTKFDKGTLIRVR